MNAPPINLLCHPIQENYEFLLYIQALIKAQKMNKPYRNHAADKSANSLKLNPRPAQTNSFRHFDMTNEKKTDIDLIEYDRMATLRQVQNRRTYR